MISALWNLEQSVGQNFQPMLESLTVSAFPLIKKNVYFAELIFLINYQNNRIIWV